MLCLTSSNHLISLVDFSLCHPWTDKPALLAVRTIYTTIYIYNCKLNAGIRQKEKTDKILHRVRTSIKENSIKSQVIWRLPAAIFHTRLEVIWVCLCRNEETDYTLSRDEAADKSF